MLDLKGILKKRVVFRMHCRKPLRVTCLLLLLCSFSLFSKLINAAEYSVGIVPQFETRKLHKIWQPIWDYVGQETGHQFKIVGSPTIPAFEIEFMRGDFDIAYMNPYHLVLANQKQGYIPVVRDIGKQLFGILVVRKDSHIDSPKGLDGKTLAFPAPNALGASLQMRQELNDKFGISINPVYVKTHDSVYLNVALKQAAAGGGVQKTFNRQKDMIKDSLKIIHKTTPVAPHPIAIHPRVPEDVRDAITQALIKLAGTEKGKLLLSKVPIKQLGQASMDDYTPLKEMGLQRFYKEP